MIWDTTVGKRLSTRSFSPVSSPSVIPLGGLSRNPEGKAFIFDASISSSQGIMGIALTDGTTRIVPVDGGVEDVDSGSGSKGDEIACLSGGHPIGDRLTGCSFSPDGMLLATSTSTGYITVWDTRKWSEPVLANTRVHERSTFGCGWITPSPSSSSSVIVSWSGEGHVKIIDFSRSLGGAIFSDPSYPVFSCHVTADKEGKSTRFAIAGGVTPEDEHDGHHGHSHSHGGGDCSHDAHTHGHRQETRKTVPIYIIDC
jgi:WD40 repeat protein